MGAKAALIKGGHLTANQVTDVLIKADGVIEESGERLNSRHTHGTGCTLASALSAGLALGRPLDVAFEDARAFVFEAIKKAPGFGEGHGPLGHAHVLRQY